MIPPNLDAFRKLMEAAAEVCDMNGYPDHLIAPDLHALATATPEQLLGIAFAIRDEFRADYGSGYYVTPRYAIPRETSGE